MNKENLKISAYEDGVSNLPDYPSDEGYTAAQLKAVFDARSNNEIKEKHNALVDAVEEEFSSESAERTAHAGNKENPHGVTKTQVGLSNVDNTSDMEKPVSRATQTALDILESEQSGHAGNKENPHGVTKAQVGLSNVDNTSDM